MRTRTKGDGTYVTDYAGDRITSYYTGQVKTKTVNFPSYLPSQEWMEDEIHPQWRKGQGGPMSQRKYTVDYQDIGPIKTGYYYTGGNGLEYNCIRRCSIDGGIGLPSDNFDKCESYGPEAWNRFKPAKPKASLGQFIAELRDFPSLFNTKLKRFGDLGSGYLNVQFGWKPFISDIRRWYSSMCKLDKQLARLRNENGKWLKRSGTLFEDQDVSVSSRVNYGLLVNNYCTSIRQHTISTSVSKCWFKGSFRYYIPGLQEGEWGNFRVARRLWGAELTPGLLWEITPWSWLVDWVSNAGDVLDNLGSVQFDNMAAKKAYVMLKESTTIESTTHFTANHTKDGILTATPWRVRGIKVQSTKCRAEASPFGFNLDWNDFNPFQLSILSALGIKRL